MSAYYNEIDEYAAQWLRNLIAAGHIAPGDVDTRSITEAHPDDIKNYTQCHFFAGIGVWSHALRRAGWADARPVWTGSCPCQPFSTAGKGAGFDDERHLWPVFGDLIRERRPATVFGEQVASKDAEPWLDLVQADLEAMGYAFGAVPFPSAGIGAPHIRDRLYWVADANGGSSGQGRTHVRGRPTGGDAKPRAGLGSSRVLGRMGDAHDQGLERHTGNGGAARRRGSSRSIAEAGVFGGLADSDNIKGGERCDAAMLGRRAHYPEQTGLGGCADKMRPAGPTNGHWRDADWLLCRDGKWRPVEPGTFPLAHGITNRVGRLRAYGNAICAEAAVEFIKIAMDYRP